MDEPKEVGAHLVKVVAFVEKAGDWVDAKQIAKGAQMVERTVRAHARRMVELGVFDVMVVFPSHRYRFSKQADKKCRSFMQKVRQAAPIFGCKMNGVGK